MKLLFLRLILSLLFLALLCGRPSSILGQGPQEASDISRPLPTTIPPSYKSTILEDEISTTGEYFARCWLRVSRFRRSFMNTCLVYFYSGVEPHTGGHKHDNSEKPGETMSKWVPLPRDNIDIVEYPSSFNQDPKLRMKATYSGWPGFAFKVEASIVGQEEGLTACNGFPGPLRRNCSAHTLHVKHPNLSNFRATLDKDDGQDHDTMVATGSKAPHEKNHFGTSTFNRVLQDTAQKYHDEFYCYEKAADGSHLGYQPIGVNDMSLPYGGVFDINQNWKTPHSSPGHHKGLAADIRYRNPKKFPDSSANSIIYRTDIRERFVEIFRGLAADHGTPVVLHEFKKQAKEHLHIEIR